MLILRVICFIFQHLAAVYQTDFSVTNRLLSPYNNGGSGLPHHQPSVTISYRDDGSCGQHPSTMPGWQTVLPNEQGGLPSKHYSAWRAPPVPNTSLQTQGGASAYPSVGYGGPASASSYTQAPDSSTAGLSVKEKSSSGIGTTLSDGDKLGKYIAIES